MYPHPSKKYEVLLRIGDMLIHPGPKQACGKMNDRMNE